ncbi:MAG: glycosyltransferase family 2 protein [Candidatus Zixiibacteriota bacterium]
MMPERQPNPKVSVIIPALNEEGNIDELCRLFAEMLEKAPFEVELVLIDDGSVDATYQKMVKNSDKYDFIRTARHQRNRGLTEALQTGFRCASGEVYVFYPADLQYLPEDIPALVEPIFHGADVSTGWKQGQYKKWFVSQIYNWMSRKIFNLKVHDLNSVKAFRKEVVQHIFMRRDWHRYLVVLAASEGFRVDEVKIALHDRKWGESKFSMWRIPIGVLDMMAVKFQITFLRKPLLFFGVLGSIMLFGSFLVGLWAIFLKYCRGETQLPLLYLVVLLAGLGLGLFMMGFMAEGLTAIKEEVSDMRRSFLRNFEEGRQQER